MNQFNSNDAENALAAMRAIRKLNQVLAQAETYADILCHYAGHIGSLSHGTAITILGLCSSAQKEAADMEFFMKSKISRAFREMEQKLAVESMPAPPCTEEAAQKPEYVTRNEIAEMFAVSPQTVANWEQVGCPVLRCGKKGERGRKSAPRYNLAEVQAWLKERGTKKKGGSHE